MEVATPRVGQPLRLLTQPCLVVPPTFTRLLSEYTKCPGPSRTGLLGSEVADQTGTGVDRHRVRGLKIGFEITAALTFRSCSDSWQTG